MRTALLIVDVQNDFCPGGALPVPNGDRVVEALNEYLRLFQAAGLPTFASRDWHPRETSHFLTGGGLWPAHCVQGTVGAEFHPRLRLAPTTIVVSKGSGPAEDAYSAFQARSESGDLLGDLLAQEGVGRLLVGGLATDYCVKASVLDALGSGLEATLLIDASRGVNVKPGDSEEAIADMVRAGASVVTLERIQLDESDGGSTR